MANAANNSEREKESNSLDDREDGEYNGIDFVGISQIYMMQDACLLGTWPFDRV